MENALNLLLQDKTLKWYTYINGRPVGPLSAREIVQRIQAGDLSFGSHVWKDGFRGWTRIYDVIDFKPLLPAEPSMSLIQEFLKTSQVSPPSLSPKQKEELRVWFVHQDNVQSGPFSEVEITSMIDAGTINGSTYLWQRGFTEWMLVGDIAIWSRLVAQKQSTSDKKNKSSLPPERREAPRRPFQAKILMTDGKDVGWAICRDISVGGMQILMDHVPCKVDSTLKLNVNSHGSMEGFACEGVVTRILEDGRGFCFRFTTLSKEAKKAIEKYIVQ